MSKHTTVSVTRVLDAPREVVWRVHTVSPYFEQWFGAVPGSAVLDVRSGGSWTAEVLAGSGESFTLSGRYVEVEAPSRLVVRVPNGDGEVEITTVYSDSGDGTCATVSC